MLPHSGRQVFVLIVRYVKHFTMQVFLWSSIYHYVFEEVKQEDYMYTLQKLRRM
jgi:hypothetical protein